MMQCFDKSWSKSISKQLSMNIIANAIEWKKNILYIEISMHFSLISIMHALCQAIQFILR
jgi:hypothetical protein